MNPLTTNECCRADVRFQLDQLATEFNNDKYLHDLKAEVARLRQLREDLVEEEKNLALELLPEFTSPIGVRANDPRVRKYNTLRLRISNINADMMVAGDKMARRELNYALRSSKLEGMLAFLNKI